MTRSCASRPFAALVFVSSLSLTSARAQELPFSGATGFDYVYATSPVGETGFFAINVHRSATPFQFGSTIASNEPSTWAHRRRTMGGLETAITSPERGLFFTPFGNGVGNGGVHLVDLRGGVTTNFIATGGNPAAYDLAILRPLKYVFSAEDDGNGHTLLRGFSYASLGTLTPLTPATLTLPGAPAAYVNRIGVDLGTQQLHVPTSTGVQIVALTAAAPQMTATVFLSTAPAAPATNPIAFDQGGSLAWVMGTTTFGATVTTPLTAGYVAWDSNGASSSGVFGTVPTAPSKMWVPAVGTEELAVVSNGTDAYAYYLLREPGSGTFFVKPSAIGVVRFIGANPPAVGTILMPNEVGEPFSIPSTFGTRIAFESSFGLPFTPLPPGGGEVVSILYSPLDPLGASSVNGVLGVPDPLGGRISTKGMERPIWSLDGTRVFAATSHFPGAPNPGIPGIEVLNVPQDIVVDSFVGPHTVAPNLPFPNQTILFPGTFRPRSPSAVGPFGGLSFFGCVFNQGMTSIAAPSYGEIGQLQLDPSGFVQSPAVPDFPSILPATFDDVHSSVVVVPLRYGARRTTFNSAPAFGFAGMTMSAAMNDEILVQLTGVNVLATFGLALPADTVHVPLPASWITTSEFHSL